MRTKISKNMLPTTSELRHLAEERLRANTTKLCPPATEEALQRLVHELIMNSPEILNGQVSIAFGIASAENKDQLVEALKLSDQLMYQHKSVLKNCS